MRALGPLHCEVIRHRRPRTNSRLAVLSHPRAIEARPTGSHLILLRSGQRNHSSRATTNAPTRPIRPYALLSIIERST